jgi:hypothetical protein
MTVQLLCLKDGRPHGAGAEATINIEPLRRVVREFEDEF